MTVLGHFIPDVSLSEEAFVARHRVLRFLLWLHVPVVLLLGYANDEFSPGHHGRLLLAVLGGVMACGVGCGHSAEPPRPGDASSVGFILSADALVHAGGG